MNLRQSEECKYIFRHYGERLQLVQFMEELAELQSAIARKIAGKENNMNEEMADVSIMLEQFNNRKVEQFIDQKLDRQMERIKNERENIIR